MNKQQILATLWNKYVQRTIALLVVGVPIIGIAGLVLYFAWQVLLTIIAGFALLVAINETGTWAMRVLERWKNE